jgi:LemA protein
VGASGHDSAGDRTHGRRVALAIFVVWLIATYNGLVVARNRFQNAFAQIDVQLKRRYDLIPNLVEAVKGAMAHERETLDAVIRARNAAASAGQKASQNPADPAAIGELNRAEAELTGSLGRMFALTEAYPDLKANTNMLGLQEELSSTENKVAFARQAFNDGVTDYNTAAQKFPANMVSGMFGFRTALLLESTGGAHEREAPKVSFK